MLSLHFTQSLHKDLILVLAPNLQRPILFERELESPDSEFGHCFTIYSSNSHWRGRLSHQLHFFARAMMVREDHELALLERERPLPSPVGRLIVNQANFFEVPLAADSAAE